MRLEPHRLLTKRMNSAAMRTVNAIELLELVRQHGPVSRARLAELSNLSKPTVSDQVDSLIAEGLIVDVGIGRAGTKGGKRPTLIQLNGDYGRILSVDVGAECVRFASSDLLGRRLQMFEQPSRPERGPRVVVGTIKRGISELVKRDTVLNAKLRIISVAVPGSVNVREGVVLETDNVFGWTNLQLGTELKKSFGCQVYVDNDVNMAALAEIRINSTLPEQNFVLMRASTGIGAAVVFGGEIHHGAHWSAGEIAHLVLALKKHDSGVARRGYLESVVGIDRIALRLGGHFERGELFRHWIESQDAATSKVREDVAVHLGTAIANISAVLDPDVFVLLGETFAPILSRIQDVASRLVPWPIHLRLSRLGDEAALEGTVVAGLSRAYENITWMLQSEGNRQNGIQSTLGA